MGEQNKTFEEALDEYKSKKSYIQLPDLDMAMHPNKIYFTDDISNKERFNEQFIESHVNEGMSAFAIYLMMGMHNVLLPSLIYVLFFLNGIETDPVMYFGALVGYLMILTPLILTAKNFHPTPMRFNRQAQCIHIFWTKTEVITFPWKIAVPFSAVGQTSSGHHSLVFMCPVPENATFSGKEYFHSMEVPGAFDSSDFWMSGNLKRLEFIRAYMEKGLSAIQPNQEAVKGGYTKKPSGHLATIDSKGYGLFEKVFYYLLAKPGYYLATGWLVDKWVQKRADAYVWPEEVEKLCREGANLSGIDTSIIVPRDDLFYGEIQGQFTYFDRNGNEVS